jgi:hypothetical protein
MLKRSKGVWLPGWKLVLLMATFLCGIANAGTVYQAAIVVSPQMQMREGEVHGCGFQLKSLPKNVWGEKAAVMLDVSLNLYSDFYGGMKGGALQIGLTGATRGNRKTLPISNFWLKAEGQKATTPIDGKVMPANDFGYMLYLSDFPHVADLFYAVLEGKEVSLGVHVKSESVERIYVGVPSMEDAEKAQSNQCMVELLERVESLTKEAERKSLPKQ